MLKKTNLISLLAIAGFIASGAFMTTAINAEETAVNKLQLAEHHGDGHKKYNHKHHMKKMDTDGDGQISKDEFMAHAEKRFSKKDKNNDGFISKDEMKRQCHKKRKPKQEA